MEAIKEPFLTIDPGINIGIAGFFPEIESPVLTNVILPPDSGSWELRSQLVLFKFEYELNKYKDTYKVAYVEYPQYMENGSAGKNAARSGGLVKLCANWGVICYILRKAAIQVRDVEIGKWKGQLDKNKIDARIERRLKVKFPNHVADAVGIGLHLKGLL
jgi:hypothetical protein